VCYNQAMSKVTVDDWFFSDSRFKNLIAEERFTILLIASSGKSTIGTISTRSGFVHGTVKIITDRLVKEGLISTDGESFSMVEKSGKVAQTTTAVALDDKYTRLVQMLYKVINETAPGGAKEVKPNTSDYKQIKLMVEKDNIAVETIAGILNIYTNIPFWGEKYIVQSASGLRKHWLKIYQSAEKHYTKSRVEKI